MTNVLDSQMLQETFESYFLKKLNISNGVPLQEAIDYTASFGGKRIRPLIILNFLQDQSIEITKGLDAAVALECVHLFSLIHDDLPAIDDDDYRKGKPTLHKTFSESIAILTGDYFLAYAFETVSSSDKISPDQKVQIINLLSSFLTRKGMIEGQILDVINENKSLTTEEIFDVYDKKTGKFLRTSVQIAAAFGQTSKEDLLRLDNAFYKFGIAYQIYNDLKSFHKPTSSDNRRGKSTIPLLHGQNNARDLAESLAQDTLSELRNLSCPCTNLFALIKKTIKEIS